MFQQVWSFVGVIALVASFAGAGHAKDKPAAHGGILVDDYYYHLPMFSKTAGNPHSYQAIWRVEYLDKNVDVTTNVLKAFQKLKVKREFIDLDFPVFSVDPNVFVLEDFGVKNPTKEIGARIFAGHFEKNFLKEITDEVTKNGLVMRAKSQAIDFHKLGAPATRPKALTYVVFGGKYMAKRLTVGPDSDHIVEFKIDALGAKTPDPIPDGSIVEFTAFTATDKDFLKSGKVIGLVHLDPGGLLAVDPPAESTLDIVGEVFKDGVLGH